MEFHHQRQPPSGNASNAPATFLNPSAFLFCLRFGRFANDRDAIYRLWSVRMAITRGSGNTAVATSPGPTLGPIFDSALLGNLLDRYTFRPCGGCWTCFI
jgi:hypothetical protein